MAKDPRIKHLIQKDLDGELSALDAQELDRLCLSDPESRRERETWKRARAAFVTWPKEISRLPVEKTAAGLIDRLSSVNEALSADADDGPRPAPFRTRWPNKLLARWSWWLKPSLAFAFGAALLAIPGLLEHDRRQTPAASASAAAHKEPRQPAVEIDLGEMDLPEEPEPVLVTIRL